MKLKNKEIVAAIKRQKNYKVAQRLGVVPGTISQWLEVPAHHVLKLEKILGISRHKMRPDIYGREKK